MPPSPERTVSSHAEAPAINRSVLQKLKFKARAPNGKICSWGQRTKLDANYRWKARDKVKQTPAFLMADAGEQTEMLDAASQETDEKRKRKGRHTSSMFHDFGKPIIQARPDDLVVTPKEKKKTATSEDQTSELIDKLSKEGTLGESESESESDSDSDSESDSDSDIDIDDDDEDEADEYLTNPDTPKRSAKEQWADIMSSSSSKRPRRSTIGAHTSSSALQLTHATGIPDYMSPGNAPIVNNGNAPRKPGQLSAPMPVPDSYALPTASPSNNRIPSTYRGKPLIIIEDDEDDEVTPDSHVDEDPGLSTE